MGLRKVVTLIQALRKSKIILSYEVVNDQEERDDETDTKNAAMWEIDVTQPSVELTHIGGKSVFAIINSTDNSLILAVEKTARDSKITYIFSIKPTFIRVSIHTDKGHRNQKHWGTLN